MKDIFTASVKTSYRSTCAEVDKGFSVISQDVSGKSAGLISKSFQETFWWKFSRIQVFWNGEF